MVPEKNESASEVESTSIKTHSTDKTGALFDHGDTLTRIGHSLRRRRRLLVGALAALVLVIVAVLGIPWIQQTLSTVSTDDAFVNGHVTFVAARVPGQVSRVLVVTTTVCT
jgi:membrane fusion protein (multidrug efflux system)